MATGAGRKVAVVTGKAHAADPQLWLSEHRRTVLAAVALAGAAAGAAAASRRR